MSDFDELLTAVRTRESSTLTTVSLASSASLILYGVSPIQPATPPAVDLVGFFIPILGVAYRELTILTIDLAQHADINEMLGHGISDRYRQRREIVRAAGHVRGYIFRFLLLLPSFLWLLRITGECSSIVQFEMILIIGIISIGLSEIEWASRERRLAPHVPRPRNQRRR